MHFKYFVMVYAEYHIVASGWLIQMNERCFLYICVNYKSTRIISGNGSHTRFFKVYLPDGFSYICQDYFIFLKPLKSNLRNGGKKFHSCNLSEPSWPFNSL